jgi:hypothetical protein
MRYFTLLVVGVVLTGLFGSCKDDPSSSKPPNTPVLTITIFPDSAIAAAESNTTFRFVVKQGSLPLMYYAEWTFDSIVTGRNSIDSMSFAFASQGVHHVSLSLKDTSGRNQLAYAKAVVTDTAKAAPQIDTTSHDFVWTEFTTVQGQNDMTGCWIFGPNDIWTVNDKLCHFDGTTWTTVDFYDPKYPIEGLSGCRCFGFPGELWLVDGGVVTHCDLSSHKAITYHLEKTGAWHYPGDGAMHGLWGTSSSNMYYVGDSGTILHFDGSNWSKLPNMTTADLQQISGTSDKNIWVCGYNLDRQVTTLIHYDGTSWRTDPLASSPPSVTGGFLSVWTCDSGLDHRAFTTGSMLYRKTDDKSWLRDSSSLTTNLYGQFVTGSSSNNLFVVGTGGSVLHWNGNSWKRYDQYYAPSDQNYFPHQIYMKDGTICIAGFKDYKSWVLIGKQRE